MQKLTDTFNYIIPKKKECMCDKIQFYNEKGDFTVCL